ncbi:MAG: SpoIIIAH-like family protein [Oscillospiraceae bacterium]
MKKRRLNMIIGKKQIILASLTCMLGLAIYINYLYAQSPEGLVSTTLSDDKNYGDAEFVNADAGGKTEQTANTQSSDDYFAQARLDRQKSRDEAVETMQTFLSGGDLTADEISTMTAEAVNYSTLAESENKIETVIKAQGFEDCLVYLDGKSANVLVKTDGLDSAGAAQIKSAVLDAVDIGSEFITIVEVK